MACVISFLCCCSWLGRSSRLRPLPPRRTSARSGYVPLVDSRPAVAPPTRRWWIGSRTLNPHCRHSHPAQKRRQAAVKCPRHTDMPLMYRSTAFARAGRGEDDKTTALTMKQCRKSMFVAQHAEFTRSRASEHQKVVRKQFDISKSTRTVSWLARPTTTTLKTA